MEKEQEVKSQIAGGAETGSDEVISDPTTPNTTGRKYRLRKEILDENVLLKIEVAELKEELSEWKRNYEVDIEEKNKIIKEKEKRFNAVDEIEERQSLSKANYLSCTSTTLSIMK